MEKPIEPLWDYRLPKLLKIYFGQAPKPKGVTIADLEALILDRYVKDHVRPIANAGKFNLGLDKGWRGDLVNESLMRVTKIIRTFRKEGKTCNENYLAMTGNSARLNYAKKVKKDF